jgi:hypothetical protein
MNRKRTNNDDTDNDDDSGTCASSTDGRSIFSQQSNGASVRDFFDQGLPKKKQKPNPAPDPRIPLTLEELLESSKTPEEQFAGKAKNISHDQPPSSPPPPPSVHGDQSLVPVEEEDQLHIIEGCPLCAIQAHVRRPEKGYLVPKVKVIDEMICSATFYVAMEEIYHSIAAVVNTVIREETLSRFRTVTIHCTVDMVRTHYEQKHRVDPGIITHQLARDTGSLLMAVKNDVVKQNPLTQAIELNYNAINTFTKLGTFLMKTLSTDLTKLSGYQVGTTGVNANRKKASLVQISEFSM